MCNYNKNQHTPVVIKEPNNFTVYVGRSYTKSKENFHFFSRNNHFVHTPCPEFLTGFAGSNKRNFDKMDTDGDGFISKDEMKAFMKEQMPNMEMHDHMIDPMINEADLDKDGKLSQQGSTASVRK